MITITMYCFPVVFGAMIFWCNIWGFSQQELQIANVYLLLLYLLITFVIPTCKKYLYAFRSENKLSGHFCISNLISIVLFYSFIYSMIESHFPLSFTGVSNISPIDFTIDFIYFSIVTFTTVGYGEIHPITSLAKVAASSQIIVAFLLIVIYVSMLHKKQQPK